MKLNASAYGRKGDLRDGCGNLKLVAESPEEAAWLSALYRVVVFGGELEFRQKGKEKLVVVFGDEEPPCSDS